MLRLLAEGLPNKQIAYRLDISDHTVKFHVNGLLRKLGPTAAPRPSPSPPGRD